MAGPIGEAFVELRLDDTRLKSDAKSAFKKIETEGDAAGEEVEAAFKEASGVIEREMKQAANKTEQAFKQIDVDLDSEFETAGESSGGAFSSSMGAAAKGGMLAIGVAAAALVTKGFSDALGREDLAAGFEASLGLTEDEAKRAGDAAGRVYRNAWGDSIEDVGSVVESAIAGLGDLDDVELDAIVSQALAMEQAFGIDANEAINSATLAVTNGLAKDGTAALDLLTGSMQNLTPVVRDEVLAATNEYSKSFAQLGIDGPAAFGLLTKAGEQGIIGIDKAGDSIKEFTIRATDGSKTSKDAFEAIGLDADAMGAAILAGGDEGAEAFETIIAGLGDMKDPFAQSQAAIGLFGTPLEDLGTENIPDFIAALGGTGDELGEFEGSAQAAADALGGTTTASFTAFKREAMGKLTDVIVDHVIPAMVTFKDFIQNEVVPIIDTVWQALQPTIEAIQNGIQLFIDWVAENWPLVQAEIDKFVVFLEEVVWPIVEEVIALIQEQFENFKVYWDELWPEIQATLQGVWDAILVIIDWAITYIETAITVWVAILTTLWNTFGDTLLSVMQTIWEYIVTTVQNGIDLVLGIINVVTSIITGDWSGAWEAIQGVVQTVWDQMQNIISTALALIQGGIQLVLDAVSGIFSTVWDSIYTFMSGIMTDIASVVESGIQSVVDWVTGLPARIATAATGAFDAIYDAFKSVINLVITGWNNLGLPGFQIGGWTIGKGPFTWTAPTLSVPSWDPFPYISPLANGGVVNEPTIALIGEAGPEVVVPLSRQRQDFLPGVGGDGAVVSIANANFYDGTDADLVAQKTMMALSARRLTA